MSSASKKIMAGLADADAYLKGEAKGHVVQQIPVPTPDVAAIRLKSGLSQKAFAQSIGAPVGTLQGWEQGRRRPDGPARVLLALIDKHPGIVLEELAVRRNWDSARHR